MEYIVSTNIVLCLSLRNFISLLIILTSYWNFQFEKEKKNIYIYVLCYSTPFSTHDRRRNKIDFRFVDLNLGPVVKADWGSEIVAHAHTEMAMVPALIRRQRFVVNSLRAVSRLVNPCVHVYLHKVMYFPIRFHHNHCPPDSK